MKFLRPAISVLVLLAVLVGCGASQRETTLRASFVALNAARDGFVKWDAAHQAQLVEQATSKEDGRAKLDAYRIDQSKVVSGFETAYRAIAAALMLDDGLSLQTAQAAAALALGVVARLVDE